MRSASRRVRVGQQPRITIHSDHALATHKLTLMRDPECKTNQFRQLARELGTFLAYELTRNLPLCDDKIAGRKAIVAPILRAGLVLADGALEAIPAAHVGHLSFRRVDDESFDVAEHMVVLPSLEDRFIILLDAVIGTGKTACAAIETLKAEGVPAGKILFGTLLASPQGINRITDHHHDVFVHAISIEDRLDNQNHIVPGFGDASDRLFGIKNPKKNP